MKTLTIVIEPKRVFARVTEDASDVLMLEAYDDQSHADDIVRDMHKYCTRRGWDCQVSWRTASPVKA